MNPRSTQAVLDRALKAFDCTLSARFVPAEDIQSEDDSFTIDREGAELRASLNGESVSFGIQCCTYGGGFAVNRYHYDATGELHGVAMLADVRSARGAAAQLIAALAALDPR